MRLAIEGDMNVLVSLLPVEMMYRFDCSVIITCGCSQR